MRVVQAQRDWCDLLTFNVRQVKPKKNGNVVKSVQAMVLYEYGDFQLIEWRFRPGLPESPPEAPSFYDPLKHGATGSAGLIWDSDLDDS